MTEVFTVRNFILSNAKETDFANCSVVLGTVGEVGLALGAAKERFPEDTSEGDQFFWSDGKEPLVRCNDAQRTMHARTHAEA